MPETKINVVIPGGSQASFADWEKAMSAPEAELPPLTDAQRDWAKRFDISEEEYRRGLLVGRYGDMRQYERGDTLGRVAVRGLSELFPSAYYFVEGILYDAPRNRWVLEVMAGNAGKKKIAVDPGLADALIDVGSEQDIAALKKLISESVIPSVETKH